MLIHFTHAFKTFDIINLTLLPINSSFHLLAASALDRTRGAFTELTHVMLIVSNAIPLPFSKWWGLFTEVSYSLQWMPKVLMTSS